MALALSSCSTGPLRVESRTAPPAPSTAHCTANVCSALEEDDGGQVLVVENGGPVVVTVQVTYTELVNVTPSLLAPLHRELASGERAELVRFQIVDPYASTQVRTQVNPILGSARTVHDTRVRYAMPFGGDTARCVIQGVDGGLTHMGPHAFSFDFEMPEGTPVLAAREGVVLLVADGHVLGGPDPGLVREANRVVILHADGTFGRYVHLRRGLAVAPGEAVARGQRLGDSGSTGYTAGPHLHFDVGRVEAEIDGFTIPVRFEGNAGEGVVPVKGACYPPAG